MNRQVAECKHNDHSDQHLCCLAARAELEIYCASLRRHTTMDWCQHCGIQKTSISNNIILSKLSPLPRNRKTTTINMKFMTFVQTTLKRYYFQQNSASYQIVLFAVGQISRYYVITSTKFALYLCTHTTMSKVSKLLPACIPRTAFQSLRFSIISNIYASKHNTP